MYVSLVEYRRVRVRGEQLIVLELLLSSLGMIEKGEDLLPLMFRICTHIKMIEYLFWNFLPLSFRPSFAFNTVIYYS
jgi:hypothetical protein